MRIPQDRPFPHDLSNSQAFWRGYHVHFQFRCANGASRTQISRQLPRCRGSFRIGASQCRVARLAIFGGPVEPTCRGIF